MRWKISYHSQQVTEVLKRWPNKILGKYLRIIDLIEEHGPQLGKTFTKTLRNGLFEIRIKAEEGDWTRFLLLLQGA